MIHLLIHTSIYTYVYVSRTNIHMFYTYIYVSIYTPIQVSRKGFNKV